MNALEVGFQYWVRYRLIWIGSISYLAWHPFQIGRWVGGVTLGNPTHPTEFLYEGDTNEYAKQIGESISISRLCGHLYEHSASLWK